MLPNDDCEQSQQRYLQNGGQESSCCANCDPGATRPPIIRIVTYSGAASTLQQYLNFYKQVNPKSGDIRLSVVPSLQDLEMEALSDIRTGAGLYDGFVIPPTMMGGLFAEEGLASLDTKTNPKWSDLLPYYRYSVATFDGSVRAIPLFAGDRNLLLYRKDYLDSQGLPVPRTWSEFVRVAAALHKQPLGNNGTEIYGACLGRLSEAGCRRKTDVSGETCNSQSMSYLGIILSQMTQVNGNVTGWLFDFDSKTNTMIPLLDPTLERALVIMENMSSVGAPDELNRDSSMNLELFGQGQCAMTISADHPSNLLGQENVGFELLPGSHNFLDRSTNEMEDCTESLCPHGINYETWDRVNRVPFGANDMMVGSVSSLASTEMQATVKDFFEFAMRTPLDATLREQPLTYSGIAESPIPGYGQLMEEITASSNSAIPFRVPNSFSMLEDLDTRVYDYLVSGNFSDTNRRALRLSVEQDWARTIQRHDRRPGNILTSTVYEKSLGTFTPEPAPDLYIGTTVRAIGWSLGGFTCLTSLLFALWVWKNQNERVIRASQKEFLYMICLGTFILSSSIFPFGIEDDIASEKGASSACMAAMWLYSLGFTTTLAALFSKTWTINRAFESTGNLQRIKVESLDILLPFGLVFGVNFVTLLAWTIIEPLQWVRRPVDDTPDMLMLVEPSTYGECDSGNYRAYLGIIITVNLVAALFALVQAYEIRQISTEYCESLWISAAIFGINQVWLICLPILKLVIEKPQATFIVKIFLILVPSMACLLCLFIPKTLYLKQSRMESGGEIVAPPKHEEQAPNPAGMERRHSDTSHDPSWTDSHRAPGDRGHFAQSNNVHASTLQDSISSGLEGIRVIQSSLVHSEQVERLQRTLNKAEDRNKALNRRLERLQEKMEQYYVANHPHDESGAFILAARPEQLRASGNDDTRGADPAEQNKVSWS